MNSDDSDYSVENDEVNIQEDENSDNFEENSASDDDEFFEQKTQKENKHHIKKLEFEEEETKEKFLKRLHSILSQESSEIMSKNKKLKKENEKLRQELSAEITREFEDQKIYNKDHKDASSYTKSQEDKYRSIATTGIIELFSAVQKAKKEQIKKEEIASGYSSLKNSFAQDNKTKWNVLTDELIEADQ